MGVSCSFQTNGSKFDPIQIFRCLGSPPAPKPNLSDFGGGRTVLKKGGGRTSTAMGNRGSELRGGGAGAQ